MENALLQLLGNGVTATLLVVVTYLYIDERKQHVDDLRSFNEAHAKIIIQEAEARIEIKALAINQLTLIKRILKKLDIDV
jgi:hypothetical protein